MASNRPTQAAPSDLAFELKTGSFTLPVLRLLGADMDAVAAELSNKFNQASPLSRNIPLIIDLKGVPATDASLELPLLVGMLRSYDLVPVALRGGTKAQVDTAQAMELAILADGPNKTRPSPPSVAKASRSPGHTNPTNVIEQPVRSGQRIYAPSSDLVILSQVSSGAEVMADGDIHVYGALRGRAMAGVKGNNSARIFCLALHAELLAIAGRYRLHDAIDPDLRGKPAKIRSQQRTLKIESFRAG